MGPLITTHDDSVIEVRVVDGTIARADLYRDGVRLALYYSGLDNVWVRDPLYALKASTLSQLGIAKGPLYGGSLR